MAIQHFILLSADSSGLRVTVNKYSTDDDGNRSELDYKFDDVDNAAVFVQLITQALFAYTCLPPTYISENVVEWAPTSPSNSSDNGINECVHSGSTE